eukprot:Sspe_Gene.5852::Locus_1951_Transcript_1_1_Confidence_1.000_Length_720::g.5852::m.5852
MGILGPGELTMPMLVVLALVVALSIMLNIFAMVLHAVPGHNVWPLLPMMFQIFAPFPYLLCGVQHGDDELNPTSFFAMFGWWLAGLFGSIGLILPAMLVHEGALSPEQLGLVYGAAGLFYLGIVGIRFWSQKSSGGDSDIPLRMLN